MLEKWNKKIDELDELGYRFGKFLPKFLEKHIGKIYFIFFLITLVAIKEAYSQRGYFAIGGEALIMILPVILDCYLKMRD